MKNGKYCILIADDEKEIRDILRLLLEGEGYADRGRWQRSDRRSGGGG